MEEQLKLIVELSKKRTELLDIVSRVDKLASYPTDSNSGRNFSIEFGGGSTHAVYFPKTDKEKKIVRDFFVSLWNAELANVDEAISILIK